MKDIFLVDDVPEVNDRMKYLLNKNFRNIMVRAFSDSEKALEQILINRPEIVITDNGMPKIDGIGLIENIYPVYRPFTILVSGMDYFDKRFDYFLPKPVNERNLIATIFVLLNNNLSEQDIFRLLQTKIEGNIKDFRYIRKALLIKTQIMYDEKANDSTVISVLAKELGITESGAQKGLARVRDKNKHLGRLRPMDFLKLVYDMIFGDRYE